MSLHSLPIFLRLTGRRVMLLGSGEGADAKRRLLERAGAVVVGEGQDVALAIVALENEAEARAAVGHLNRRGILVNAVDRPELCDFTIPAIVDRDPVLIAIGTGGASAGLAKALRQRLETLLPAGLGGLATRLFAARDAVRRRWPDAVERRRAIDDALLPGGALDSLSGRDDVDGWIAGAASQDSPGPVRLSLTSADPDELTLRQARLLGQADRIYHRPDVPPAILDRARADAMRVACAAAPDTRESGLSLDIAMEKP